MHPPYADSLVWSVGRASSFMYQRMYISIYMYVCIYIYIYIYTHTHKHAHMHVHTYMVQRLCKQTQHTSDSDSKWKVRGALGATCWRSRTTRSMRPWARCGLLMYVGDYHCVYVCVWFECVCVHWGTWMRSMRPWAVASYLCMLVIINVFFFSVSVCVHQCYQ